MSDLVKQMRVVNDINTCWSDSVCDCDDCQDKRKQLVTKGADEIERLRGLLLEGIGWARLIKPNPPLAYIASAEAALEGTAH